MYIHQHHTLCHREPTIPKCATSNNNINLNGNNNDSCVYYIVSGIATNKNEILFIYVHIRYIPYGCNTYIAAHFQTKSDIHE